MKYNRDRVIRLLDFQAPVQTHKCNPAVSVQSIFELVYSFPSFNSLPSTWYLMHMRKIDLALEKIAYIQIDKDVVHTQVKCFLVSDCLRWMVCVQYQLTLSVLLIWKKKKSLYFSAPIWCMQLVTNVTNNKITFKINKSAHIFNRNRKTASFILVASTRNTIGISFHDHTACDH